MDLIQENTDFTSQNSSGLLGYYYNNKDFTDFVGNRIDPIVNYRWMADSPDSAIDADTFSVRWLGNLKASETGTHTISTISDDGVRVWINGELVIDNWTDHRQRFDHGTIDLVAGQEYSIRMEYYENGGDAIAQLLWTTPTSERQVIGQENFIAAQLGETIYGDAGSEDLIGTSGADIIILNSDAGEPEIAQNPNLQTVYPDQPYLDSNDTITGGAGADTFRFELALNARQEIIWKRTNKQTGVVNWKAVAGENNRVHDHWVDSIGDDVITDFNRAEGDRIEIFGHTVEATYSYEGNDSIIQLYSNQNGAGAHNGDRLGTITVKDVHITQDDFGVTKKGIFYGVTETFDPGIGTGNGLLGKYYNGWDFGDLELERVDEVVDFNWGYDSPDPAIQNDQFSVRWQGYIEALSTETYDIYSKASDGLRVWINGERVIDQWYGNSEQITSGEFDFVDGQRYSITVEYNDVAGWAINRLYWHSNNWTGRIIPQSQLYAAESGETFIGGAGSEALIGTDNADTIVVNSDAGEPVIAQSPNTPTIYRDQPYSDSNDTLTGGAGIDTFRFELAINAKERIIWKHTDKETGIVNWQGVAGENNKVHDHWVDSIGDDVITDFDRTEGDRIEIYGHTVEASIRYEGNNSIIDLVSNQGGAGAHQGDRLGTITVLDNLLTEQDITVTKNVFYGVSETFDPEFGEGNGLLGKYYNGMDFRDLELERIDSTIDYNLGYGSPDPNIQNDQFSVRWQGYIEPLTTETYTFSSHANDGMRVWINGEKILDKWGGNAQQITEAEYSFVEGREYAITVDYYDNKGWSISRLYWQSDHWGKKIVPQSQLYAAESGETIVGGAGSEVLTGSDKADTIIANSDAGEPEIAQNANAQQVYPNQPYPNSNDTLTGGAGIDTFRFELAINAKDNIARKHADSITGVVDWQAVAGENNNVHDHWVDSIGNDVITDFNPNEGDRIEIYGHTVQAQIKHIDTDLDQLLDSSVIELYSNQGGAGAHDGDFLGDITVQDSLLQSNDITVNKNVFYGAYEAVTV